MKLILGVSFRILIFLQLQVRLKFFFFQETLATGALCKIQSQGWKESGLHNILFEHYEGL